MQRSVQPRITSEMQQAIDDCENCHSSCVQTVEYCLQTGGKYAEESHSRLLLDCAQICQTSADYMLRGSDLYSNTCSLCADVCEQCARDCDQFGGDTQMKACADVCRQCAQSCRQMAGTRGGRRAA